MFSYIHPTSSAGNTSALLYAVRNGRGDIFPHTKINCPMSHYSYSSPCSAIDGFPLFSLITNKQKIFAQSYNNVIVLSVCVCVCVFGIRSMGGDCCWIMNLSLLLHVAFSRITWRRTYIHTTKWHKHFFLASDSLHIAEETDSNASESKAKSSHTPIINNYFHCSDFQYNLQRISQYPIHEKTTRRRDSKSATRWYGWYIDIKLSTIQFKQFTTVDLCIWMVLEAFSLVQKKYIYLPALWLS